jgi:hypothetical protein
MNSRYGGEGLHGYGVCGWGYFGGGQPYVLAQDAFFDRATDAITSIVFGVVHSAVCCLDQRFAGRAVQAIYRDTDTAGDGNIYALFIGCPDAGIYVQGDAQAFRDDLGTAQVYMRQHYSELFATIATDKIVLA